MPGLQVVNFRLCPWDRKWRRKVWWDWEAKDKATHLGTVPGKGATGKNTLSQMEDWGAPGGHVSGGPRSVQGGQGTRSYLAPVSLSLFLAPQASRLTVWGKLRRGVTSIDETGQPTSCLSQSAIGNPAPASPCPQRDVTLPRRRGGRWKGLLCVAMATPPRAELCLHKPSDLPELGGEARTVCVGQWPPISGCPLLLGIKAELQTIFVHIYFFF